MDFNFERDPTSPLNMWFDSLSLLGQFEWLCKEGDDAEMGDWAHRNKVAILAALKEGKRVPIDLAKWTTP